MKIVCDVCGTTFPETESHCPVCGCAKSAEAQVIADEPQVTTESGSAGYSKGGRFSQNNVQRRSSSSDPAPSNENSETADNTESVDSVDSLDFLGGMDNMESNSSSTTERRSTRSSDRKKEAPKGTNKGLIAAVIILLVAIIMVIVYIGVSVLSQDVEENPKNDPGVSTPSSSVEIPCTSITLGAKNIVLSKANESFALAVTKVPTDTTDKVVFASADPTIAAVDQKGNVTPVGYGETEIIVTCGKITEKCKVVSLVGEPPVTEPSTPPAPTTPVGFVLKLETYKNSGEISFSAAGATHQLYKTTMGITAADITWTSSDPAVATVENGKVTAVNSGTCTITAAYGDQTATCLVRCSKSVVTIVSDYKLSHVDVMISDGETFTLTLSHKETGARVQDIEWQVSAEGVVTIDGNKITGGTVSKTTVVEVFVEYEGVTYTCIVRVKATGQ